MPPRLAALLGIAFLATGAAAEAPQWPPSPEMAERIRALQETLRDPEATAAQREAAREELAAMLKSAAGKARGRTPDEKPARPARAAIDPYPSVVKPSQAAPAAPPPAGVARLEVVQPPKPVVDPRRGTATTPPAGGFAIDPPTGRVLHETPGGFVDPATGRFIPR